MRDPRTVAGRLERHGAGLRTRFSTTFPRDLAAMITSQIGTNVTYKAIPVGGAKLLADVANDLIEGTSEEVA
jgi:hypothetical protein